jgi:transposase-like protein
VQRYAPELNERIRRELKPTNGSWRTDETYVRVGGRWTYLYRAVDSTGATIDFFLSETRDLSAALTFFRKALAAPGHPRPRVINVDGNPSYPTVIRKLKQERALGRRCRCRIVPYLNNIVEQDHRSIKRRVNASLGFRSFDGAQRTIQGYEAMHMIRKGQVRWLSKGDIAKQVRFIKVIFGVAA